MKDKKARDRLEHIEEELIQAGDDRKRWGVDPLDLSIKDCPRCKHLVMTQKGVEKIEGSEYLYYGYTHVHHREVFTCLTCGSKFACSEKEVCELIDG